MAEPRHVAVIDIGKTNAKLALVDLAARSELAALRRPNRPLPGPPFPHHDVEALWPFILEGLGELRRVHPVDAISVTTHGATAALVDAEGRLALPVLDYEFDGPDRLREAYEAVRPPFAQTGSPGLPLGLNLGAQLFWLQRTCPEAFARTRAILTWPQFWSWKLTGVAASEATSLGCHTDLWSPHERDFSPLVDAMGWRGLLPPLRHAGDTLGPLRPEIAARTGLDPATPVVCGIHDSNASLLPHLIAREPPFSVVSTGTWVVAMAVGGRAAKLDPGRDTLINVNAFGDPVPSARFMGGREFETLLGDGAPRWTDHDMDAVLSQSVMLLPSIQRGSGPFPARAGGWVAEEPTDGRRFVAISFYLALMTATCLDLIGADGETAVEGPFAANQPYMVMLSAATGRPTTGHNGHSTGTSIGAAMLAGEKHAARASATASFPPIAPALQRYAAQWKARLADPP